MGGNLLSGRTGLVIFILFHRVSSVRRFRLTVTSRLLVAVVRSIAVPNDIVRKRNDGLLGSVLAIVSVD